MPLVCLKLCIDSSYQLENNLEELVRTIFLESPSTGGELVLPIDLHHLPLDNAAPAVPSIVVRGGKGWRVFFQSQGFRQFRYSQYAPVSLRYQLDKLDESVRIMFLKLKTTIGWR